MSSVADRPATVSIGILCYNQADLIGRVIASARQQSEPVGEILVVDDGSTDASRTVVAALPAVRLVCHEVNRGRAAARTTVLQEAKGDVVVYLDGDTLATPDLVARLLAEYDSPDVAAVGAVVEELNQVTAYDRWRARHGTKQALSEVDRDAKVLYGWGLSCRRHAGLAVGGFRPASEDIDFSIRLREAGYRLVLTPYARVQHLRTDDGRGIRAMAYRWGMGGYVALARHGDRRVRPHLDRLWRRSLRAITGDLRRGELGIAAVGVMAMAWQSWGVLDAWRRLRHTPLDTFHRPSL